MSANKATLKKSLEDTLLYHQVRSIEANEPCSLSAASTPSTAQNLQMSLASLKGGSDPDGLQSAVVPLLSTCCQCFGSWNFPRHWTMFHSHGETCTSMAGSDGRPQ
jgi:hypothetical protein